MNAAADAPGANDDASGVAAVLETARVLSKRKFGATLVYAALSGEEQGLIGGRILADYAKAQGWDVLAVLNNDIVGNTHGLAQRVENRVRVFSEGVRSSESEAQANTRRSVGGEVDSPSRNLARYMDDIADTYLPGFDVSMVYRRDRFGRGGDQIPMMEAGFPAVRVTEAAENYTRQHQDSARRTASPMATRSTASIFSIWRASPGSMPSPWRRSPLRRGRHRRSRSKARSQRTQR
jgi:Zn-dependent M28 family amino/carboxypeptidase